MNDLLTGFSFHIFQNENYFVPFTSNISLIYVIDGSVRVDEGEKYYLDQNGFSVVNIGNKLTVQESPDTIYAVILFRYDLVRQLVGTDLFRFQCNSTKSNGTKYERLRYIIGELLSEYYMEPQKMTAMKISIFSRLLHDLIAYFCSQNNAIVFSGDNSEHAEIVQYIWKHYSEKISQEELAAKYYMSPSAFSRFFKNACGITFLQYLTNVRLHSALSDLLFSDKSLTDIALDNGFSSTSLFDRTFLKTYGMSPSQYRKKARTEIAEDSVAPGIVSSLEPYHSRSRVTIVHETHSQVREISVDGSVRQEYDNPWKKMICLGTISQMASAAFEHQFEPAAKQLHFTYGKIWGFFAKEMFLRDGHETENLNFNVLDSVLDLLVRYHVKPVLFFENSPVGRIVEVNQYKSRESEAVFLSLDEALSFFDKLFQHLCFRYGLEEVESWMAEFWYDEFHDTFLGLKGSITDYYDAIAGCIKKRAPHLKIGGCGMGVSISEDGFRHLLRTWKRNAILPDFISVYCFPVRRISSIEIVAERMTFHDFFRKEVFSDRMIMDQYNLRDIPLYVTSWSLSFSDRNYFNDSCGKAALMLHIMVDEMDTVAAASYYALSDLSKIYAESYKTMQGGKGLITTHGIAKPSYYAMSFITNLYPLLVDKGENYIITVNNRDQYCILLFNNKNPGYSYYSKKETEIQAISVESVFENTDDLELTLSIKNVENGFYYIRKQSVSPDHGNVLSEWLKLSVNDMISADDLQYLRYHGVPYRRNDGTEVTDNTLTLIQRLTCHEIMMLEVFR